jgi:hypothetical protein
MACGTPVIANPRDFMLDRLAIAELTAERFTVSAMIDKYVQVYRDVIGRRQ